MIHREGLYTILMVSAITTLLFVLAVLKSNFWLAGFFVAFFIIELITLWFFRNPNREISEINDSKIYAPADGKVVVIEKTLENEYFNDTKLMISIFMSPLNVHSNHHPVGGKVMYEKYHPGKYLVAWHPKSSTENERHTTVYKNDNSEVLIRQIAGAMARRIVNYVKVGDKVKQGGEVGFIKFGSRVDVYLPKDAKVNVKMGQKVSSRIDVIAEV
ncbi:MAG: phosphatidylserine decarboxylase family protein [Saprospiraceae bacterium]